ncbi:MAG: sodium:solute symporter, partial [Bacteroidales bacterium]|nr:sodium:solute symporter [Bacteroidales bacterium]
FSGGMLGLFLLALVCRKVSRPAAVIAVILGLLVIAYMSLPVFKSPFHTYLTSVVGTTTLVLAGFILTRLFTRKEVKAK